MRTMIDAYALTNATQTDVTGESENAAYSVEDRDYIACMVVVTGGAGGDVISVNLQSGLSADLLESLPMIGCPLTLEIAAGETAVSQMFQIDVRAMPFIRVLNLQTDNGSGCTVSVHFGGRG